VIDMPPKRRLLSTGEAAAELGISRRTLSGYARDGILKPAEVLPGPVRRHYRWDLDDLRRQLREIG
jgi:DNA-binding transcriptional MerR regulator